MSARLCPACHSPVATRLETVTARVIAEAWDLRPERDMSLAPGTLLERTREDLGADSVDIWHCSVCRLEFADPARAWRAEYYPVEEYGLAFDHQRALHALAGLSPLRLLELGCADGKFLEHAAALGHFVSGLDFSTHAVARARQRGLDVRLGGVSTLLDQLSGAFDVVALFQLIEHLEDPDGLFEQIDRLATGDATLLIGCPAPCRYTRVVDHPQRIGLSDFWDYPPQHTLRWTPTALARFLARHGWTVTESAAEPLSIRAAAAHLCALHGLHNDWYRQPWARRSRTFRLAAAVLAARATRPVTGIRMHTIATRGRPLARRTSTRASAQQAR